MKLKGVCGDSSFVEAIICIFYIPLSVPTNTTQPEVQGHGLVDIRI